MRHHLMYDDGCTKFYGPLNMCVSHQ